MAHTEFKTLNVKISSQVMRETKSAAALAGEDMSTYVEEALKQRNGASSLNVKPEKRGK
jgi:predicted HicB family RNase H-like nuclease